MGDPSNGPPGTAARLYAAARAVMDPGGPAFGVHVLRPGAPTDYQRARSAYNDPSAYPLPDPRNWLSSLVNMDPSTLPKHVQNWLTGLIAGAAQDPMSAVLPFLGAKGAGAARAALVGEGDAASAAELSQRMKDVNQYLGQRRSEFAAGLEPPPTRELPVKQYATERAGHQVSVTGETVLPPERITPEQARAAGVTGPVPYEAPQFQFTRTGPRVDVYDTAPAVDAGTVIKDAEGAPQKLYHHSWFDVEGDFDRHYATRRFNRDPQRLDAVGSWFTSLDKPVYGPKVTQVELNVKKPFYIDDLEDVKGNIAPNGSAGEQLRDMVKEAGGADAFRQKLIDQGYDGIGMLGTKLDGKLQDVWITLKENQARKLGTQNPSK